MNSVKRFDMFRMLFSILIALLISVKLNFSISSSRYIPISRIIQNTISTIITNFVVHV